MADTLEIELISNADIKEAYPFYQQYPLMDLVYKKGKNPIIYHMDLVADSITNTLAEIGAPTNKVFNYTTPVQVYLRSSNAGDTSKDIDVIGEKADGTFGQFTLTSDDTDGTTAVDCGTWNFIATVIKNDTWAGNAILDDDGSSTTVYWTAALGATATTGIVVVPTGYKGALLSTSAWLLAAPSNVNAADRFEIGSDVGFTLNSYITTFETSSTHYAHLETEKLQVAIKAVYTGAAETDAQVELYFIIWEE